MLELFTIHMFMVEAMSTVNAKLLASVQTTRTTNLALDCHKILDKFLRL